MGMANFIVKGILNKNRGMDMPSIDQYISRKETR